MQLAKMPGNTDLVSVVVQLIFGLGGWAAAIAQYVVGRRRKRNERSRNESLIVRKLLRFLEEKRVLYSPIAFEVPRDCVVSVLAIRERLQEDIETLEELDGGEIALQPIRSMQAGCRSFLDRIRDTPSAWGGIQELENALGNLRSVFGEHMESLYEQYEVQRGDRPTGYGPVGLPLRRYIDVPDEPPPKADHPEERQ